MGEYAEYELQRAMRRGIPARSHPWKKRPESVTCPICGMEKAVNGLDQHIKAKHPNHEVKKPE